MSAYSSTDLQSIEYYMDSDFADYNYTTNGENTNLVFFIEPPIIVPTGYDCFLRLENAVIPISFFLVDANNQALDLQIGVNIYNLVIPVGNYNALQLEAELNILLAPYNIGAVFDATINQYTFTKTTPTEFTFLGTSTCFRLLGFTRGQNHTSVALVLQSQFSINLSGTNLIYVDILNLSTRNISSRTGGHTTIVKTLVESVPYGSILCYTNNTNSITLLKDKYISYIHIRLLGDDYNLLNLDSLSWNMTWEFIFRPNGRVETPSLEMMDIIQTQEQEKENIRQLRNTTR
jgi:hypothetical protein